VRSTAGVGLAQRDDVIHRDVLVDLVAGVHERLDRDGVAGLDREPRLLARIEPAPLHVVGRGLEHVVLAGEGRTGETGEAGGDARTTRKARRAAAGAMDAP